MSGFKNFAAAGLALALTTSVLLTGCGSTASTAAPADSTNPEADELNITVQDLVDANTREVLMANHCSTYTQLSRTDGAFGNMYMTPELGFEEHDGYDYLVTPEGEYYYFYDNESDDDYLVYVWYAMSDEEGADRRMTPESYTDLTIDLTTTPKESLQSVEDNGDGTLTMTTLFSKEDYSAKLEASGSEYPDYYFTSELKSVYLLDKESLEVLSIESFLVKEDGSEEQIATETVTYDSREPEMIQTMTGLAEEFFREEKENPRTITVIYDAGTADEQSYSITLDQQFKVLPVIRDGYTEYADAAKTAPYEGGDGKSDKTIYAFKDE